MAKIRFEGVTITANAIEIEGVEDPAMLVRDLGLEGTYVKEGASPAWEDKPPVEEGAKKKIGRPLGSKNKKRVPPVEAVSVSVESVSVPPVESVSVESVSVPPVESVSVESVSVESVSVESVSVESVSVPPVSVPPVSVPPVSVEVIPEMFSGARRLRDIVQVFMDANVTDVDEIVATCVALKEDVSLLKRVSDIPGRIPPAVEIWIEKNK
jgi:hypothetical protein